MIKNYIVSQFKEIAQEIVKASREQNVNVPSLPSTPLGTPLKTNSTTTNTTTTTTTTAITPLATPIKTAPKTTVINSTPSKGSDTTSTKPIDLSSLPISMSDQEIALFYIKMNAFTARLNPLCLEIENQSNMRK